MPKLSGKKKSAPTKKKSNVKTSGSNSAGTSTTSRSSQQRAFRLRTDPSERQNRPRPRDSHEPDSMPLLELSSDNETENKRSTGLSALPPVVVPSRLPDTADLRGLIISAYCDGKLEEFHELGNATQDQKLKVPVVSPGTIKFTRTLDFVWTALFPGLQVTKTAEIGGLSCGYMRISGFSVKPVEMVKDFTLILAVIDGVVVAKSSEIAFQGGKKIPHLVSNTLEQGCSLIVHNGSFYSLENWTDEESAVHFTMVKG